jgi:hypothetical protein
VAVFLMAVTTAFSMVLTGLLRESAPVVAHDSFTGSGTIHGLFVSSAADCFHGTNVWKARVDGMCYAADEPGIHNGDRK